MKTAIQGATPPASPPPTRAEGPGGPLVAPRQVQAGVMVALLLAASFMLAYGCAGNQPGAGLGNEPPPPPPDNSTIKVVGVNDFPPPPPSG